MMMQLRALVFRRSGWFVLAGGILVVRAPASVPAQAPNITSENAAGTGAIPPPGLIANALPYQLAFKLMSYPASLPPLPGLQGYTQAESNGRWLVVGGRVQGLHTFDSTPTQNFPRPSFNRSFFVIEPTTGKFWSFDLGNLPPSLADPLSATSQQGYYDRAEDMLYVVGGYGYDSNPQAQGMKTFPTLTRIKVGPTIDAITSMAPGTEQTQRVQSLIASTTHDQFAVTGGGLKKVDNRLYLIFGQKFDGSYYAFSGPPATQEYTEAIRQFLLKPETLELLGPPISLTSSDPSHPYHRRDGSVIDAVDPATGQPRFIAFGGVFQVGTTLGFDVPICLNDNGGVPTVEPWANVRQRFSQYECPMVAVYDPAARAVSYTSFGGISHAFFTQTPRQKTVYDLVRGQIRADGVPFIGDISTMVLSENSPSAQFILPEPIPMTPIPPQVISSYFGPEGGPFSQYKVTTTNLIGSSIEFWPNSALMTQGKMAANGVVRLDGFRSGESAVIGYIYGGVTSVFPYALVPNTGTYAGNSVFAVTLTRAPASAYPVDLATEAPVSTGPISVPTRP